MGVLPLGGEGGRVFGTGAGAVVGDPRPGSTDSAHLAPLARALGYLGVTGALLGFLGVLLPHPEQFDVRGLLLMQALTLVPATWMLYRADRAPAWMIRLTPAYATLLVSLSIFFSGDATSAYAMFYLWVGLYTFYFLSRAEAAAQIAFAAASYAVVILITGAGAPHSDESASGDLIHHFVIAAGTLVIAGFLLLYLRGKVEQLMVRLTDAARTDLLTGLRNSRGIHEVLDAEVERAHLGDRDVSLLVTDLDNFKAVNDRLGHRTGDRVLRRIGELLDEATRRLDTVGRTGAGEFAIILPEADESSAYLVAEQLLARIRRAFADDIVPLTTSIGVATYPDHARDAESLFKMADEALFAAKALGRDRAVRFSPEVAEVLSGDVSRRSADSQTHLQTVLSLAEVLDLRESGTAGHSQMVGRLAEMTARELGLDADRVERVRLAGILHDIGKVGVADSVLKKPGPLDDDEWSQMRQHPEIGARILGSSQLGDIREWVLASHERPDGRGYPRGLAGEEIPLEARILAVADAYEAMTADRVYRPAIGQPAARVELRKCAGAQFDPTVVTAFLRALDRESIGALAD